MTLNRTSSDYYTDSPKPHPNLILGSIQLLFWLLFRPTAWKNNIKRLDPSLNENIPLFYLLKHRYWQKKKVFRFVLQGLILLPILTSLIAGLFFLLFGSPFEEVIHRVVLGALYGVVLGTAYGIAGGIALGITLSLGLGVVYGTALGIEHGIVNNIALELISGLSLGVVFHWAHSRIFHTPFDLVFRTLLGLLAGMAGGIVYGVLGNIVLGVGYGIAIGLGLGLGFGIALSIAYSAVSSVLYGLSIAVALGLVYSRVVAPEYGCVIGITLAIGVLVNWWRPIFMSILFIPISFLLYRIDELRAGRPPSLLRKHIAFWDEWQRLPLIGLDKHLLLTLDQNPTEGQAALHYLSDSRQRWAAQAAQIELDTRRMTSCIATSCIAQLYQSLTISELDGPADALFRSFNRISEDVNAALNQTSAYNKRLALTVVQDRLDGLIRELTRSGDKYAVKFSPIAKQWCNIISLDLYHLTHEAEKAQEIDSPYIIGVPLTERQAIFVGRTDISTRIEQLLLDRRRPPLLLYGQRRTGKTSLLNNLGKLLPNSIVPLFVDLQGPAVRASNRAGFLYNLAKGMTDSAKRQRNITFPTLSRANLAEDPFTTFDEWLDTVEIALVESTALLALDEFEVLDHALTTGKFNEADVLGMLRNLIQQRPRFKVLIAGSHTLQEFQRWSSYLINAQVLHLSTLKESEARQLIEHPSPDFALRYEPAASQRVLDVTHCHPYLVQSLCAEIVVLKNEQDPSIRRLATLADVEAAIPEALSSGSMFFSDIERNQVDAPALAVLKYIANQGEGASVSESSLVQHLENATEGVSNEQMQDALSLLIRRELIEKTESGHYQIQIELFRRWFAQSS